MGRVPARTARPRMRQVVGPDVAGLDRLGGRDGDALRLFGESVAAVAGEASDRPILHAAEAAHAITGVEAAG